MIKRGVIPIVCVVVGLLVAGCAKPPEELVEQARAALQAAEAAGAALQAPAAWDRARQAMAKLEAELALQEQKGRFSRRYAEARRLADEAASAANQALTEAKTRVTQLRTDLGKALDELKGLLDSARARLAPLGRSAAVNAVQLGSQLDAAARGLDLARSDLEGGRFDAAQRGVSEARAQISAVLRVIEQQAGVPASKKR